MTDDYKNINWFQTNKNNNSFDTIKKFTFNSKLMDTYVEDCSDVKKNQVYVRYIFWYYSDISIFNLFVFDGRLEFIHLDIVL